MTLSTLCSGIRLQQSGCDAVWTKETAGRVCEKDVPVEQQTAEVWPQLRVSLWPEGRQVLVPSGLAGLEIRVANLTQSSSAGYKIPPVVSVFPSTGF